MKHQNIRPLHPFGIWVMSQKRFNCSDLGLCCYTELKFVCPMLEMPKLKTSELKVRSLLTKKAPTEKMENIIVPQVHLQSVQSSVFFYVKRMGDWSGKRCLMITDIWANSRGPRKIVRLLVLSLFTLVDVIQGHRFLKSLGNNHFCLYFPYLPGRGPF